jgi:excisionase family DNA binding protein
MSYSYNSFLPLPQSFSLSQREIIRPFGPFPFHSLENRKTGKMLTYFGSSLNMDWYLLGFFRMDWNNMTDTWLTVKEVARYLKLSPDLIYKLAQQGKIPASKVGTAWRFKKEKIDRWMEGKEKPGRIF